MPRGQVVPEGTERINANGYRIVKRGDRWPTKAQVLIEQHIGRQLMPGEYVDLSQTDKANPKLEELVLRNRADKKSPKARLAILEEELREHEAIIETLKAEIVRVRATLNAPSKSIRRY